MKTYILGSLLMMSVFLNAVTFSVMYDYENENSELKAQVESNSDLQQRFNNVLRMLQYQNKRVLELEDANEALLKYAEPKSVVKAIKHTPLPPLKG